MNAGYYYHVPALFAQDGTVRVPGFYGRFLVELAREAGRVVAFLHETPADGTQDMALPPSLVECVNLGPAGSVRQRTLSPGKPVAILRGRMEGLDALLIRGPSPLLPALAHAWTSGGRRNGQRHMPPLALLLVSDYTTGVRHLPQPLWRKALIGAWAQYNRWQQDRLAGRALVMVNSAALKRRYVSLAPNLVEVFTSAISEADLAPAPRTELHSPVRLLYAGRIDKTKGLLELVEAAALLLKKGIEVKVEIAGFAEPRDPTEGLLRAAIRSMGLTDKVSLAGYLASGMQLTGWLRSGDIFINPSYAEGFPRAILDAMAAGLPVIATRVGGVPDRLKHGELAWLIEPRSAPAIAEAVTALVEDDRRRARLAGNGLAWVRHYTNESSCELIVRHLRAWAEKGETLIKETPMGGRIDG